MERKASPCAIAHAPGPSPPRSPSSHAPTASPHAPPTVGKLPSNLPLASLYRDFNASMVTEANKYPGVKPLDLFKTFTGHGIDETAADTWFVADCIHPNAEGHDAIRKPFWSALP